MSRNRYIIRALEQVVQAETHWSLPFRQELADARNDAEGRQAIEEMVDAIAAHRSSKGPPAL